MLRGRVRFGVVVDGVNVSVLLYVPVAGVRGAAVCWKDAVAGSLLTGAP